MEIAPIPGIRTVTAVTGPRADLRLAEIFDLEGAARTGYDRGQRQGRKAAGAEEDDEDNLTPDADSKSASAVDCFA